MGVERDFLDSQKPLQTMFWVESGRGSHNREQSRPFPVQASLSSQGLVTFLMAARECLCIHLCQSGGGVGSITGEKDKQYKKLILNSS